MTVAIKQRALDPSELAIATVNALDESTLDKFDAWQDLADLSSRTMFEAIDADPSSLVWESEHKFTLLASIYVTLAYGPSNDEASFSDEYPATIKGQYTDGQIEIKSVEADVTSFYE